jgi:exopolysaccharide biosynthesis protein
MLMLNRTQAYTDTAQDRFTRRTVVAQDVNGHVVLVVTPLIGLPLLDLSQYLSTTDMNLVNALNLDGGGSTLMYLNTAGIPEYVVTSLDPVPAVLAVYPRL